MHQFTMRLTDAHKARIQQHALSAITLAPTANQGADVSQWCGSVFDQDSPPEGCCTACSTRDYLLWLQNKYGYPLVYDPSVNALYYFARQIFGDLSTDDGSTTNDAYQGAITYGVIPSVDDEYSTSTLYTQPPIQDVIFKALSKTNFVANTASIRASLDSGLPVGISVVVEQTLFTPSYYNGMHIVDTGTDTGEGHAIFCVAYKPDSKYGYLYKFQNSWGTSYGDNGYAWFTEAYLNSCLMEVVQLDIPKSAPTKPYALTASFTASSVTLGTINPLTVKTTLSGQSCASQSVTVKQVRTDTGTLSSTWTTDANGQFVVEPKLNEAGSDIVTVSWTPTDGVTRTETVQAVWSDTPTPPVPQPTPQPVPTPVPPKPVPVYPREETDLQEHHKGIVVNGDTYVPPELWERAGSAVQVDATHFTVNGKTYLGVIQGGTTYIHYQVMKDAGYTLTKINPIGWTFTK